MTDIDIFCVLSFGFNVLFLYLLFKEMDRSSELANYCFGFMEDIIKLKKEKRDLEAELEELKG